VSDSELLAMGLQPKDHSPSPTPKQSPEIEIFTPSPGVLKIRTLGRDEEGHGKPKGVHGAELRWTFAETPPVNWSELTRNEIVTRSPLYLAFSGHDRGRRIYLAARWENSRGAKGPWTEIMSAVVP
jgi:hypothetical protein